MSCGPIGAAARFRIRWSLPLRNKFLVDSVFNDLEEAEFVANILGFLLREVSLFNALGFSMREVSLLLDFSDCEADALGFSLKEVSLLLDFSNCEADALGFSLKEVSLLLDFSDCEADTLGFSLREVSLLLDFGDCGVDSMLFSRARLSAICEIDIQSCIYVIITTIIIRCTDDEISDAEISRNGSSSPKALVAEARHLFCLIDII